MNKHLPEIPVYCIQCLEACTTLSNEKKVNKAENSHILEKCANIFISFLNDKVNNFDELSKCRVGNVKKNYTSVQNK